MGIGGFGSIGLFGN